MPHAPFSTSGPYSGPIPIDGVSAPYRLSFTGSFFIVPSI